MKNGVTSPYFNLLDKRGTIAFLHYCSSSLMLKHLILFLTLVLANSTSTRTALRTQHHVRSLEDPPATPPDEDGDDNGDDDGGGDDYERRRW